MREEVYEEQAGGVELVNLTEAAVHSSSFLLTLHSFLMNSLIQSILLVSLDFVVDAIRSPLTLFFCISQFELVNLRWQRK